jgi:hypothetical protein
VITTPEQLAQAARETQSHISSFYEARPDLLND